MWVFLEDSLPTIHRPPGIVVPQKETDQSPGQLRGDLVQGHHIAGPRRTRHLQVVAIVVMELLQRLDDQVVDGEHCFAVFFRPLPVPLHMHLTCLPARVLFEPLFAQQCDHVFTHLWIAAQKHVCVRW